MKKIKFNWGTGLLISMIIFMIISTGTTILFMNQDVELVTDDYYEKTLKYQDKIDVLQQTVDTNNKVIISYEEGKINFAFPASVANEFIIGNINFYRPSNSKKDFNIPVKLDNNREQNYDVSNLDLGLWKISVDWSIKDQKYFTEKSIIIQ